MVRRLSQENARRCIQRPTLCPTNRDMISQDCPVLVVTRDTHLGTKKYIAVLSLLKSILDDKLAWDEMIIHLEY